MTMLRSAMTRAACKFRRHSWSACGRGKKTRCGSYRMMQSDARLMTSSIHPPSRPLFLYGTLRALPLLAWVVTGNSEKVDEVTPLIRSPAILKGYTRLSLVGKDYPALVKRPDSEVDGLLFVPKARSQRVKLDHFEGETYRVTPVQVDLRSTLVDADAYVWIGDEQALSNTPWDLQLFIKERLEDWLDCFAGMEMVGDDEETS
jgi:gamma-glutamylcyclotransferase (GGCT)/AIG2-like uncharacterized protein YtfP